MLNRKLFLCKRAFKRFNACLRQDLIFARRGAVTAEFAITVPIILMVVALVFSGLATCAQQISISAASAEIARQEARGDNVKVAAQVRGLPANTEIERLKQDGMLCVQLRLKGAGALGFIVNTARSCALEVEDSL